MPKPRKTRDCWRFYLNYGHGWEHEITEYTRAEMKENRKAYRENCSYPLRIKFGRERIVADLPEFSLTVERAKREVLADVAAGKVPPTCATFAELHNYVDANSYGGAFDLPFENEHADYWNAVQDAVDTWIKSGGIA